MNIRLDVPLILIMTLTFGFWQKSVWAAIFISALLEWIARRYER